MSDSQPWEPLGFLDFFVLGLVGTFQLAALGVCIHLVIHRKWPPYVTRNVNVVVRWMHYFGREAFVYAFSWVLARAFG